MLIVVRADDAMKDKHLTSSSLSQQNIRSETEKGSGEVWSREDGLSNLDGIIMVDYS